MAAAQTQDMVSDFEGSFDDAMEHRVEHPLPDVKGQLRIRRDNRDREAQSTFLRASRS